MAILDAFPGIEVNVQVNRQPLEEYDDDEPFQPQSDLKISEKLRAQVTSKYIKSVTGEQFTVNIAVGLPYIPEGGDLEFRIEVDGIYISSYHYNRGDDPNRPRYYIIRGQQSNDFENRTRTLKPFQFSKLETDESKLEQVDEDTELVKGVGEIIVSVYRKSEAIKTAHARDDVKTELDHELSPGAPKSKSAKKPHNSYNNSNRPELEPLPAVHEKALKGSAKSHTTSYGPERVTKITEPRNWSYGPSRYLDGRNHPIAIFRFKYRSEKALKQLLILKRTPEPDRPLSGPEPEERSWSSHASQLPNNKVKRERDRNGNGNGVARSSKRARKVIVEETEVVDLTGDSDDEMELLSTLGRC